MAVLESKRLRKANMDKIGNSCLRRFMTALCGNGNEALLSTDPAPFLEDTSWYCLLAQITVSVWGGGLCVCVPRSLSKKACGVSRTRRIARSTSML